MGLRRSEDLIKNRAAWVTYRAIVQSCNHAIVSKLSADPDQRVGAIELPHPLCPLLPGARGIYCN